MPAVREIPPGKVLLADFGPDTRADRSTRTLLDSTGPLQTDIRLDCVSPGWEPAGSRLRWTNGGYAVTWRQHDGSTHGRRFRDEGEARAYFAGMDES